MFTVPLIHLFISFIYFIHFIIIFLFREHGRNAVSGTLLATSGNAKMGCDSSRHFSSANLQSWSWRLQKPKSVFQSVRTSQAWLWLPFLLRSLSPAHYETDWARAGIQ